jgi:hypothetical protein
MPPPNDRGFERIPMGDDISIEISYSAAAMLEFTSNIEETKPLGELTYITSKDAFVWAGLAAFMAQYTNEVPMGDMGLTTIIFDEINSLHTRIHQSIPKIYRVYPPPESYKPEHETLEYYGMAPPGVLLTSPPMSIETQSSANEKLLEICICRILFKCLNTARVLNRNFSCLVLRPT